MDFLPGPLFDQAHLVALVLLKAPRGDKISYYFLKFTSYYHQKNYYINIFLHH